MSYTEQDLEPLVRGDDWVIKLSLKSGNSVLDITGYSYWMTLKADIDDPDPGAIQVTAVPATSQDATNGIVYIKAPRAQTALVEPQFYYYDIQQLDSNDNVKTILLGRVQVISDITRAVS